MPLEPGSRIGAYQVISAIGAGGMGEVYLASDSKLKRNVAIKVLPSGFAADTERLARFQREAELLATLNHPNIASIYGLEDTNQGRVLVMELIEGPTLSDLIARHRAGIPVSEALPIARQIVDALEAAHEHGIIHRDLKPANIKVKEDGTVKVLDFGLAKALDVQPAGALANSPTITSPAMTAAGIILGTAAYMSPEQARGRSVDKRTDVWAFGAVLYETLTGKRAFDGEDVSLTLAAVMKSEPNWVALPTDMPASIRACLMRCLQKDPKQRLRDIGDVRLVLEGVFSVKADETSRPRSRTWQIATAATAIAALMLGAAGLSMLTRAEDPRPLVRFEHPLPGDLRFRGGQANRPLIAGSPDGSSFVYNASDGLYLHSLSDGTDRRLVPGSLITSNPTFSPDGKSLAYFDGSQLKRLALTGGAPVVIATTSNPFGVTWAADQAIYFASPEGIWRVSADGGTPELLISVEKGEQFSGPQLLPDGDNVLFTVYNASAFATAVTGQPDAFIAVQPRRGGQRRVLLQGGANGKYLEGYIVYTVNSSVFAVPFNTGQLRTTGGAIALTERVQLGIAAAGVGTASYDVARNGTLFYVPGSDAPTSNHLVWVLRDGTVETIASIPRSRFSAFSSPQLSKNGQRVLAVAEGDLRIYELATGRETRLTSDQSVGSFAAWVPGDRAVTYASARAGTGGLMNIWHQPVADTGEAVQLTTLDGQVHLDAWAPDASAMLVHHHVPRSANTDVLIVDVAAGKPAPPRPFVAGPATAEGAVFSPDGRFVAYIDGVSGVPELVIRPFPGPGPPTPVSVGGAREAAWARNGELFYRRADDDMMMAVPVATTPTLSVGTPVELFRGPGNPGGPTRATYDVVANGSRFIMSSARVADQARNSSARRPAVSVVLNWTEQLKQRR